MGGAFLLHKILERIKRLSKQTEESLRDALGLIVQIEDATVAREWLLWVRSEARQLKTAAAYEIVRKTYFLGGKNNFDDFMIAMEWGREPKARFWLPRRKVLEGKHKIATRIQSFMDDPDALFLGFSQPPGTGKTTIIKFLLAYIIGKDPKSANMYISYSDGMTKMLLDSVKSMLTDRNEYGFHDIFTDLGDPAISAEYKTVSYRRAGDFPTLGLVSLGGSVTGRTRANTFLVTDDLVKNKEEARSPERLDKLYGDYTATLTTRMIGDNVKQIMLGTRWSAHDPLGRMAAEHENDTRYTFISIPVWDENEQSNFEYDHPDRYTTEKIRDIKATIDSADFECLFMQHGIEKEGLAFPADSLKYYNGVLPDGEPDNICFANDVAWGGGDSLSMPIAYVYGADVYIHDWLFDRSDKSVTKPRAVGKILQNRVKMGRTEANNGGSEYSDDVYRILKSEYGYSINMSTKKAPTNMAKLTRIEQYAPDIRNFYFRGDGYRDADYTRAMNELTGFSFTAKNLHDDAPDSLAMLADFLSTGNKVVTVAKRPF
jgi:predicted phage terminase large subunit-like protein